MSAGQLAPFSCFHPCSNLWIRHWL